MRIGTVRLASVLAAMTAAAQVADKASNEVAGIPANYTESLAGQYKLPDPLVLANGKPVRDARAWRTQRRPEIVRLFEENQFGATPGRPPKMSFDVFEQAGSAFDGSAVRRQVTIRFSDRKDGPRADLLLYVPANAGKRVPVLLNIGFTANSNTVADPAVKPGEIWNREKQRVPASSGRAFGRLNAPKFLAAGFGVATLYYGDIDPDFDGGLPHGVRSLFLKPGETRPAPGEWGAISAWAWGLSRALDYLETDKDVDAKRVAVTGVSRLGKTVLWAGAHDERFAMVIASCSGEGGASLSRRNYGERIQHLAVRYGYQFAANYQKFGGNEAQFPADSHMLISLIAPRPLLLQTGDSDHWSDPRGEFLAAAAAGPVYRLLGKQDLGTDQLPPPGKPILNTLGYLMHAGGHGAVPSDWDVYLEFMKLYL